MIKPSALIGTRNCWRCIFAHYERALYLAQTENPELEALAREAAAYLGLEYEYRYTGYGELKDALQVNVPTEPENN